MNFGNVQADKDVADLIAENGGGGGGTVTAVTGTAPISSSGGAAPAISLDNAGVTYAKIQDVSATDKVLGRSTAGVGPVEEIPCTGAGRALLDDATAGDQRTTLGLGTLATQSGTFSGTSSGTNTGDQTVPTTEDIQDIAGAMVGGNTETGIAVTYDDTNGKLDFDAQTAGDIRYAPIAKGVTNGDSHDHVGGDGAAIVEAAITLADNVTNDVSEAQHGFMSKLPGGTTTFYRADGAFAAPPGGAGGSYTDFTKDLGAARRSGSFDITGLSGLTADKVVSVVQTAAQIASKGNARDEVEFDQIQATGFVLDASTIRAYWQSPGVVVGTYAFAYQVSG